ncbi:hypothetical protein Dimus_022380 [Dionaea muscipula]
MVKAIPIDLIWKKRVIRSKIVRERWMNENGLKNVIEIIKRQKWENLFKRRELVHIDAVKEFYAKMTVIHSKKRDVVKFKVRGVDSEFDHEKSATILGVPGKNGICEYIKEVWEESKYTKPLEITRRFANDDTIIKAVRVKSVEMKPSQRRLVNLPRVMMRHMSYVISRKDHELPYGDRLTMVFEAFGLPLVNKKGEEPKRYDYFEETFLTMCKSTRRKWNMVDRKWRERRRDDDGDAPEAEIDEATVEGESGSERSFMMPRMKLKALRNRMMRFQQSYTRLTSAEGQGHSESRPSGPSSREAEFPKFQANLKEKEQTDFMTIRRRPKRKMPYF